MSRNILAGAKESLRLRPAPGVPISSDMRLCAVRHRCEEYLCNPVPEAVTQASSEINDFIDCERVVTNRDGPRSWMVQIESIRRWLLCKLPTAFAYSTWLMAGTRTARYYARCDPSY